MSVKHRQPKLMPSHTDTLPEESSVVEMTKQADTHQADRSLFPCPEDGCVKSYMTHGCLEQHLMYGKHEFCRAESLSLLDRAKISYAEHLEAGGRHSKVMITGSAIHSGSLACQRDGLVGSLLSHATGSIPSKRDTWRKSFNMVRPRGSRPTQRTSQRK